MGAQSVSFVRQLKLKSKINNPTCLSLGLRVACDSGKLVIVLIFVVVSQDKIK